MFRAFAFRILAGIAIALLAGCTPVLYVTYDSDPQGAVFYSGGQKIGYTPQTLTYNLSEEQAKRGSVTLPDARVEWISGAATAANGLQVTVPPDKLVQRTAFTFNRPAEIPGRDQDMMFALELEKAAALQRQAAAQEQMAEAQRRRAMAEEEQARAQRRQAAAEEEQARAERRQAAAQEEQARAQRQATKDKGPDRGQNNKGPDRSQDRKPDSGQKRPAPPEAPPAPPKAPSAPPPKAAEPPKIPPTRGAPPKAIPPKTDQHSSPDGGREQDDKHPREGDRANRR